jgi:superfamily II RNA helicase
MIYKGIRLDPFQQEAIDAIDQGYSLLVSAPTGAGKTLIAEYAIERAIEKGLRVIYTAPIKALSNQKFRDLCAEYQDRVGIKTGDVAINPEAQIILMTTEVFRNTVFDNPQCLDNISFVIFDEIHYLDDIERGTVWEESLIFAPAHIRVICLSATVPNIHQLAHWIKKIRPQKLKVITTQDRPVPLRHLIYLPQGEILRPNQINRLKGNPQGYEPRDWQLQFIRHLRTQDRLPAIYFTFSRQECEQMARSVPEKMLSDQEAQEILKMFDQLCQRFLIQPNFYLHLRELISKGVAFHHAGLLPTLKEVIERIFSSGLLKLLFATETFAVGVNMPARTVVFHTLTKFDGVARKDLKTREYYQMAGRAGRRGIDTLGYVYTIGSGERFTRTFEQVTLGEIEPIRSQFNLSYSALLRLYSHMGERIYQAFAKSLSNYQDRRGGPGFRQRLAQMRRKLRLLEELGYLEKRHLTEKGRLALGIHGYELQIVELYWHGLLSELGPDELNILMCAIVNEAKVQRWYHRRPLSRRLRWIKRCAHRLIQRVRRVEEALGIHDQIKPLDFKLTRAMEAFSKGCSFDQLERYLNTSEGDFVRSARMTIQLARQSTHALRSDPILCERLEGAIKRILRDEVDPERQLMS